MQGTESIARQTHYSLTVSHYFWTNAQEDRLGVQVSDFTGPNSKRKLRLTNVAKHTCKVRVFCVGK